MNEKFYFPVRKNTVDHRVTVYVDKKELPKSAKPGSLLRFKLSTHGSKRYNIKSYVAKDVTPIKIKWNLNQIKQ